MNGGTPPTGKRGVVTKPAFVLALLTLVYASGFADRNIINLLIDPIKAELGSNDTALGLVAGFGFAALYLVLAIPMARLADRTKRLPVLLAGLVLWSVMTTLTGFASSLMWIAVARLGVGVGEACLQGPAYSLLSDIFPKRRRPMAFSILSCGAEIGITAGLFVGGLAAHLWGWRSAFFAVGAPGLAVAAVCWLFIREPARGAADAAEDTAQLTLAQSLRSLARQRSYVFTILAGAFMGLTVYTMQVWGPSFVRRAHHLNSAELGAYLGFIRGPTAIVGSLLGGYVTQRLEAFSDAWRAWTPALTCALAAPCAYLFLWSGSLNLALLGFAGFSFFVAAQAGPIMALCQSVAPPRARSLSSSLFFYPSQIIGLGVGSVLVGWLSDRLTPSFGAMALRDALIAPVFSGLVVAAASLYWAGRHVGADMNRAEQGPIG